MNPIEITELNIYPIKSTAGLSLNQTAVTPNGLAYDRCWGLFDETGQVLTGRDYPQLLGVQSTLTEKTLDITIKDGPSFSIPLSLDSKPVQTVKVFSEAAAGVQVSPELDAWFSTFLQTPTRLLFMQEPSHRPVAAKRGGQAGDIVSFADECPILLISEASLAELNGRLETPVTMAHFRPNIVVSGCEPFAEDSWTTIEIGGVVFDVAQACKRCVFTTIDPITQEKSPRQEPLRTLGTYRKQGGGIIFGMHLIPRKLGTIAVGQRLSLK